MELSSKSALNLQTQLGPDWAIVRLVGSASMAEAEDLRLQLESLAAQRIPLVVLDLGDLEFICSQGLGAMISLQIKSRHHNGMVRLVRPRPAVRELLELTRLTKMFPIYADVQQALGR